MIFGVALANITHNLDNLRRKDGESISSHAKLKEEGLACLRGLIEGAPYVEYVKFFNAEDHGILIAYTLNVLCQYSKSDKSRSIRTSSLETMLSLMNRLESIHGRAEMGRICSIKPIVSALPGVSSSLFQLTMSDTKLPRNLLVVSVKALTKLISLTFLPCNHKLSQDKLSIDEESQQVKDICDNLAIRLNFLIDYTTNNVAELPKEMMIGVLDLCQTIICESRTELLISSIGTIVKYLAFMQADNQIEKTPEVSLKLMVIIDSVKEKIQNCDDSCERLDSVIMSGIFKILQNLESNAFQLLAKERQSELAILTGFLKLLPEESLTTLLEFDQRRKQLIDLLIKLSEFSTNQPFLLLTDSKVNEDAIQISGSKIYSVEKRFKHLAADEINQVNEICQVVGSSTHWPSLNDILCHDLRNFSDPGNLHITHLILRALTRRKVISECSRPMARFTAGMLSYYVDSIQEKSIELDEERTLIIVIAIESIATLLEIHLRFVADKSLQIIILKDLLCPLLKWASSGSRAISEAALSTLTLISRLYGYDSTKSLIEANIDYIVDGVMRMLENFSHNYDVTHVLAITFKLSSKTCFYYFKDVFERLFRVLSIYQHTEKAQSILLLFYRTLATLVDWRQSSGETIIGNPLENNSILERVKNELSIKRRIHELSRRMKETHNYRKAPVKVTENAPEDEAKVIEDIKAGKLPDFMQTKNEPAIQEEVDNTKEASKKSDEIVLAEKILTHCVSMISSDYPEIKILALKTAALGFEVLRDDEDTLLPLVHKLWSPLEKRLVGNYGQNLEVSLCAFECLISMAANAKDFIKRRTLDSIIPRICLFLESQAKESSGEKDYGPYGMTVAYKCQLKILTHLGALAYHIELAYSNLWRVVRTTLVYLNVSQMKSLRDAAKNSLHYLMSLDTDCVWYFAKQSNLQADLPFYLLFDQD